MASPVPAKSQPLHNFSLPHLKWKNHRSGRSRLAGETSSSSPPHRSPSTPCSDYPPLRQSSPSYVSRRPSPLHKHSFSTSPMRDSESESEQTLAVKTGKPKSTKPNGLRQSSPSHVSRRPSPLHKHSISISPMRDSESEHEQTLAVPIGKPKSTKPIGSGNGKRSNKICIRFRKNNGNVIDENLNHSPPPLETATPSVPSVTEEDESSPKTWNLRPRRPPAPINHKQTYIGSSPVPENRTSHVTDLKTDDHKYTTTFKKRKFSISLSRDEIEEDIYSLTGSKPSRRPKKRPRSVQKQLDMLFPGLWLGSVTADSYKVSEG